MSKKILKIEDEDFEFVQSRLVEGGEVYTNSSKTLYARVGPKESTLQEEIHQKSLAKRGYPVGTVESSGELEDGRYYFTEKSLGDKHFGQIFAMDGGVTTDDNFEQFSSVLLRFLDAELDANNHLHTEFDVRQIIEFDELRAGYPDKDLSRVEKAIKKMSDALRGLTTVYIQNDLNPFNVFPKGVIDFEYVYPGPVGYDVISAVVFNSFFPDGDIDRLHKLYRYSEEQVTDFFAQVTENMSQKNISINEEIIQSYIVMKTIWAAVKNNSAIKNSEKKSNFWEWRFAIMTKVIDAYNKNEIININMINNLGQELLDERQ